MSAGTDTGRTDDGSSDDEPRLVYRQKLPTRIAHWIWTLCLFFLLLSGLQIFNAHPTLYLGQQSGFAFDSTVFSIGAGRTPDGPVGYATVFGYRFDTTGVLGLTATPSGQMEARAFPAWATIPSNRDLATGRIVHFFFAWILVITLVAYGIASLLNGHARRDLLPRLRDFRDLPADIARHARFRFAHGARYAPLQRLSYAVVVFVLFPLIVATGLAMSPGFNAAAPWLVEVLGGRQTARTLHFATMLALVAFFVVHVLMVVAAGPLNELRSIVTGWYRVEPVATAERES